MKTDFSISLRDDVHCKVQEALRLTGIVNLVGLSEEIRLKNLDQNIAREDIESLVMQVAQLYGAAIEFDERTLTALDLPDACPADGRNDLEKMLSDRTAPETPGLLQLNRIR
jgi:hypothetical protein